jgi:hypothetical protein
MLNLHAHSGYAQLTVVAAWCTASTCRVHPAAAGMAVEMAVLVYATSFLTACQASCLNPSAIHTNGYQPLSGSGFGCKCHTCSGCITDHSGHNCCAAICDKVAIVSQLHRCQQHCQLAVQHCNVAAEVRHTLWATPNSI